MGSPHARADGPPGGRKPPRPRHRFRPLALQRGKDQGRHRERHLLQPPPGGDRRRPRALREPRRSQAHRELELLRSGAGGRDPGAQGAHQVEDLVTREFVVAVSGERLDRLVAAQLPELSRARAQQLILEGRVRVAGQAVVKASERPAAGARVTVEIPPARPVELQPEDLKLPVLYDDEELLVIDKPAGIAVHPGAGRYPGTVELGVYYTE